MRELVDGIAELAEGNEGKSVYVAVDWLQRISAKLQAQAERLDILENDYGRACSEVDKLEKDAQAQAEEIKRLSLAPWQPPTRLDGAVLTHVVAHYESGDTHVYLADNYGKLIIPPPPSMAAETKARSSTVEPSPDEREVTGSNPVGPTIQGWCELCDASLAECQHGPDPVAAQSEEKEDGQRDGGANSDHPNLDSPVGGGDSVPDFVLAAQQVAPPPVERGEIVVWNEPICLKPGFVANSVCRATKADIITAQKGNFPERNYSDQEALDDFMVVHGAWLEPLPPSSDVGELVERLQQRKIAKLLTGELEPDPLCQDAAAMLQAQAEEIDDLEQRVYMLETITPSERPWVERLAAANIKIATLTEKLEAMEPSSDVADIVDRLDDEAMRLSGHSIDRGSAEAGIAANLAREAAAMLEAHAMIVRRFNCIDWERFTEHDTLLLETVIKEAAALLGEQKP